MRRNAGRSSRGPQENQQHTDAPDFQDEAFRLFQIRKPSKLPPPRCVVLGRHERIIAHASRRLVDVGREGVHYRPLCCSVSTGVYRETGRCVYPRPLKTSRPGSELRNLGTGTAEVLRTCTKRSLRPVGLETARQSPLCRHRVTAQQNGAGSQCEARASSTTSSESPRVRQATYASEQRRLLTSTLLPVAPRAGDPGDVMSVSAGTGCTVHLLFSFKIKVQTAQEAANSETRAAPGRASTLWSPGNFRLHVPCDAGTIEMSIL
ncbi:hypothetical protein PYCCODRAFT_350440 [Trametes coccinea BRFM310]|uniref:Uncharacterized protein n=1 Tax=Trametes coccinea (strain BRFM310) TaxID=1353009 RepID=A0A1Y2J364_TRAC3|nr:hypothetical protein PYCCODRAFT_350440 [Trametes coccinea BRFM310]